jgi:8-oxo-dGTP pyrophosphatase MutT (NUDIX family)
MKEEQMKESVVFAGKIGEVVHIHQADGRVFERYRRAPGVRLVIVSPENKILMTKEFRQELQGIDLRLPGGKVCDTLEEYTALRNGGQEVAEAAKAAAAKEALEETGLAIEESELITTATAGATVEWDLYYFLVRKFSEHPDGQKLELGEDIELSWMSLPEVHQAIEQGSMHEWRSVGVLLGKVLPLLEA